jgi:2-keto-4-pentenoate hydratase/2-oxohepta-3-ene-1,7-dioic acid hydratase in catechol pathway
MAFQTQAGRRLGLVQGEDVIDLAAVDADIPTDLIAFLQMGERGRNAAVAAAAIAKPTDRLARSTVRPMIPVDRPGKIVCLGLNYASHVAESPNAKPEYPMVFLRATTSLLADGETIRVRRVSTQLDYEGELVAIVGTRASDVSEADALACVAAYGVFNDGSMRDYQRKTTQWTVGKNFDATGAMGATVVTADALPGGAAGLHLETRLNGQVVQSASTSDMLFGVAETIALLSQCMTFEPGDLLVMGTPSGVGVARKPQLFMKPGDVCEVEIESIGCVRNPIGAATS